MTGFGFSQGLYKNAKAVNFNASWTFMSSLANLMASSGIFKPVPDTNYRKWKANIQPIMGAANWDSPPLGANQPNLINPSRDLIVDLGFPLTT